MRTGNRCVCAAVGVVVCAGIVVAGVATESMRNGDKEMREDGDVKYYTDVFWGILEMEQSNTGRSPLLRKIETIVGERRTAFSLSEESMTQFWPGGRWVDYIPGHRYLVLVGHGPGRVRHGVQVIDLDVRAQDAWASSLFNRPPRQLSLSSGEGTAVDEASLDAWYEKAKKRIAEGTLTTDDVASALGAADKVVTDRGPNGALRMEAMYIIDAPSLVAETRTEGSVTTKQPRLFFKAEGNRVTATRRDIYECGWMLRGELPDLDPEGWPRE